MAIAMKKSLILDNALMTVWIYEAPQGEQVALRRPGLRPAAEGRLRDSDEAMKWLDAQ
jgi:predicted transcriptional regulator